MSAFDRFRFDGKRVVVIGGATGIGAAAAELALEAGAEVVVMDRAEIALSGVKKQAIDLSARESIEAAADACGGPIHALMLCAGVADGTPGIERINFVGHRHLVERLLGARCLPRGSAIAFISSSAGLGWEPNFPQLCELLDTTDFDAAARWLRERGKADYISTKQAVCAYVSREALRFLKQGIRLNALCPGPTDTPLAQRHAWLAGGNDYRAEAGVGPSTPLEQAYPLLFLCSDAAVSIAGLTLVSDAAWFASGMTGSFPGATPIASFLYNRPPASGAK